LTGVRAGACWGWGARDGTGAGGAGAGAALGMGRRWAALGMVLGRCWGWGGAGADSLGRCSRREEEEDEGRGSRAARRGSLVQERVRWEYC
jgi:hypothetical protein